MLQFIKLAILTAMVYNVAHAQSFADIIRKKALAPFQDAPAIESSLEVFKKYSPQNAEYLRSMSAVSCAQVAKFEKELKGVFVSYEDGDQQVVVPVDVTEKSGKIELTYFQQLPGWSRDVKLETRTVSFKNGKIYWQGTNGEKFPVQKLQEADAKKFLDGDPADSYEDKLCVFKSKARQLTTELQRIVQDNGTTSTGSQR